MKSTRKPKLAVWKFASCDGCQLTILDCEDELLSIVGAVDIAYFPEATRVEMPGPYDVSLVEGSITTRHDAKRIQMVRKQSKVLIAIGACATSGGIQALRNTANVGEYISRVYRHPEWIETLEKSTPISAHVKVDYELRGCPISKPQLVELLTAVLAGRKPQTPAHSVCTECKRRGIPCMVVRQGVPCMGPVTHAGCGALCPSFGRGCFGCYGPNATPNMKALIQLFATMNVSKEDQVRALRTYNAFAEPFAAASQEIRL